MRGDLVTKSPSIKLNEKMENVNQKITEEVALEEVTNFLKKNLKKAFRRGKMTQEKIKDDYIDVIEAVQDGNLVFDENFNPKYTLRNPLYANAEDAKLKVTEVDFRTRIREADKTELMNGIDVKKEMGTYTLKYISYITKLSIPEVKLLEKEDFEVLNEICSVF